MIAIAQTGEFHHDLAHRPGNGIEVTMRWDAPADEVQLGDSFRPGRTPQGSRSLLTSTATPAAGGPLITREHHAQLDQITSKYTASH